MATPAEATKRCTGNASSGVCYTVTHVTKKLKVLQSIPLENKRKKKGTVVFHCNFSDTFTKSMTAGASVSAGVKAKVLGVAEVESSINLSLSVTQSASRAESAAADVPLKRGEGVLCQRTYGYVTAKVLESHYSSSSVYTKRYSVKIPINMGVRVKDL